MARGIKDKVAILGMGCSKFGERWDSGAEELMLEAYKECLAGRRHRRRSSSTPPGSRPRSTRSMSASPASRCRRRCACPTFPVTHVENMRASGTEAFRGACYAVASGAADFALALGVEKLKDTGYGGLPGGHGGSLAGRCGARTAPRPATSPSSPPPT